MSSQSENPQLQETIVLEGDDGKSYTCQILDVFEFEDKEYALLLNLGDSETTHDEEKGSIVIMGLVERDDQSLFQTIESEEEFEKVVAYVEQMVKEEALNEEG